MRDDDGAAHAQADDVDRIRRLGENHLVVEDELLHEAGAAAAVLLRPRDAYVAGLEQLLLPGAPAVDECPLALAGRRFLARLVGVQPGADLIAKLPLRRAELEVHRPKPYAASAGITSDASSSSASRSSSRKC